MSKENIVKTVHVRLNQEETETFDLIAKHLGLRNDAEVFRHLMTMYYNENKDKLVPMLPRFKHFNLDVEKGIVRVLDRKLDIIADVYFRRKDTGPVVICEWDQSSECDHVKYALTIPKIKDALYQNGWIVTEDFKIKRKPTI